MNTFSLRTSAPKPQARRRRAFTSLVVLAALTSLALSSPGTSAASAASKKTKKTVKKTVPKTSPDTIKDGGSTPVTTVRSAGAPRVTPTLLRKRAAEIQGVVPVGPRALKLMPLGDDLTGAPESYRGHLDGFLRTLGLNVDFVGSLSTPPAVGGDPDHEGHGAFTIGPDDAVFCDDKSGAEPCNPTPFNLSSGLNSWIDSAEPDIVLVQVGLYDLFEGTYKPGTPGIKKTYDPAGGPKKLAALVNQITENAPDRIVVLATLQQPSWKTAGWAPFTAYNTAVMNLGAASTTDKIVAVDLSIIPIKATEFVDGFHVTDSAAKRIADQWMTVVNPIVIQLASQSGPPVVRSGP